MAPTGLNRPALMVHFSAMDDHRIERTKKHSMTDILVISICGFICGVDTWVELEEFAEIREDWFRTFLDLPNGIPSHDTFGRFFAAMDPEEFSRCFVRWVQSISEVTDGEVVPIDGKTLRRSFDRASSKAAKSNEIAAIPRLLEMLHLQGCIVTIDAMGCQKAVVRDIVDRGADYVIPREVRHLISSLDGTDAEKFARAVRSHWAVENNLHWVLDAAFDEDSCRVRKDNAPENMAMLRHIALNLLKADTITRAGIKIRRKKAGWSPDYLCHLLGAPNAYKPRLPRKGPRAAPK